MAMSDRALKRMISTLERLHKAKDLTNDGWMWLQCLKRERDFREDQSAARAKGAREGQ